MINFDWSSFRSRYAVSSFAFTLFNYSAAHLFVISTLLVPLSSFAQTATSHTPNTYSILSTPDGSPGARSDLAADSAFTSTLSTGGQSQRRIDVEDEPNKASSSQDGNSTTRELPIPTAERAPVLEQTGQSSRATVSPGKPNEGSWYEAIVSYGSAGLSVRAIGYAVLIFTCLAIVLIAVILVRILLTSSRQILHSRSTQVTTRPSGNLANASDALSSAENERTDAGASSSRLRMTDLDDLVDLDDQVTNMTDVMTGSANLDSQQVSSGPVTESGSPDDGRLVDSSTSENRKASSRQRRWTSSVPDSDIVFKSFEQLQSRISVNRLAMRCASAHKFFIYVSRECREQIEDHLLERSVELGGLLIGSAYRFRSNDDNRIAAVEVTKFVRSDQFDATSVSLTMDSAVWTAARSCIAEGELIVGWYHSHPNLGAFFSGTDKATQRAVFNHAYSVGLVSDPVRLEERWFVGSKAEVVDQARVFLF